MKLWTWSCGENRVLLLDTCGKHPAPRERGLFLCRSLTLPADRLLMGPVSWEPFPELVRMDHEGVRIPAESTDAAVFLAFLSAAGYGEFLAATDGIKRFAPDPEQIAQWKGIRRPEERMQRRLLSLD